MTEQEVSFKFSARYYKEGELTAKTKNIWFVIHGYGQLAKYFLPKFSGLVNDETCVIAPEGLSRFYLDDITSRSQSGNSKVGATWMTRENRLVDIQNYLGYLNSILKKEIPEGYNGKITLFGFSQGAATVSRWALTDSIQFHRLILWAGIFPPDMDFQKGRVLFHDKEVIEVYGNRDPFLTEARIKEMEQLNEKLKLNPRVITFDGAHEIHSQTLLQLK
jgi:predicted esterase